MSSTGKRKSTWRIYCITNAVTGKRYVGVTRYVARHRLHVHRSTAMANGRGSPLLCRSVRKHGPAAFSVEVLEDGILFGEAASAAERRWIRKLRTLAPRGYNLDFGGYDAEGAERAGPSKRAKMSAAFLGRPKSEAHRAAIADGLRRRREARESTVEGCAFGRLVRRLQRRAPAAPFPLNAEWKRRPLAPFVVRMQGGQYAIVAAASRARWAARTGVQPFGWASCVLRARLSVWIDAGLRAAAFSQADGKERRWAPHRTKVNSIPARPGSRRAA